MAPYSTRIFRGTSLLRCFARRNSSENDHKLQLDPMSAETLFFFTSRCLTLRARADVIFMVAANMA